MNNTDTPLGAWISGITLLLKAGFTKEEIFNINEKTSELTESLLQCYKSNRTDNIIARSIYEWYEGIVDLKNQGFTYNDIMNLLEDICDAYYYAEYIRINGDYEDEDNDEDDEFYDDDDEDNDDDDDFDPRRFFPKK